MDTEQTLNYYNKNAQAFSDSTINVEFSYNQNKFLNGLNQGELILDFGCGSGRDSKYFLEHGYTVEAIDGSEELCKLASDYAGIRVKHMFFQDLQEVEKYNAIWACSSILHLPYAELVDVMKKMVIALKDTESSLESKILARNGGLNYLDFQRRTAGLKVV